MSESLCFLISQQRKVYLLVAITACSILSMFVFSRRMQVYNLNPLKEFDSFQKQCLQAASQQPRAENIRTNSSSIVFTIRTCKHNHRTRLEIILMTWFKGIENQINFITDEDDAVYSKKTGGRMHSTTCGKSHNRTDLCCKSDEEYSIAKNQIKSYKWWCHFDDDIYVNIPRLIEVLNEHNPSDPVYIGRRSTPFLWTNYEGKRRKIHFATGCAICISRPLLEMMNEWMGNGKLTRMCNKLGFSEDGTIGFIITALLKLPFTESLRFHSHIEKLKTVENLTQQATLSYSVRLHNLINIPDDLAAFNSTVDPTRLLSVHCLNFPEADICPK